MKTTTYESYEKVCPRCGAVSRGEFPDGVSGPRQYGGKVKAYIVLPAAYGMVGIRRIRAIVESLFGLRVSEGAIVRAVAESGERLFGPVKAIRAAVVAAEAVHFEEM